MDSPNEYQTLDSLAWPHVRRWSSWGCPLGVSGCGSAWLLLGPAQECYFCLCPPCWGALARSRELRTRSNR